VKSLVRTKAIQFDAGARKATRTATAKKKGLGRSGSETPGRDDVTHVVRTVGKQKLLVRVSFACRAARLQRGHGPAPLRRAGQGL
jgi:hypothetical protein